MNSKPASATKLTPVVKAAAASVFVLIATILTAGTLRLGVQGDPLLLEQAFTLFAPLAEALQRIALNSLS